MDFSKAFDKVPRLWLVKKVQEKWLDPGVVTDRELTDSDRQQRVCVQNEESESSSSRIRGSSKYCLGAHSIFDKHVYL
jgi:hypothetical protein